MESEITTETVIDQKQSVTEPPKFAVFLLNDDYTTFDFVVDVLVRFFKKTVEEATEITLAIHHQGRGLAGIFNAQIAEMKALQVNDYSRSNGHPLKAIVEPMPSASGESKAL